MAIAMFRYPSESGILDKEYSDEEVKEMLEEIGFSAAKQRVFMLLYTDESDLKFDENNKFHQKVKKDLFYKQQDEDRDS